LLQESRSVYGRWEDKDFIGGSRVKINTLLKRLVPAVAVGAVLAYSFLFRASVPFSPSLVSCGYGYGSGGGPGGTCGFQALGGILIGGPDAASSGAGNISVFGRGQDNQLWYRTSTSTVWSGWASLGGIITAEPGVVSQAAGKIDVFARGQDGQLWSRSSVSGVWSGWTPLGGILAV